MWEKITFIFLFKGGFSLQTSKFFKQCGQCKTPFKGFHLSNPKGNCFLQVAGESSKTCAKTFESPPRPLTLLAGPFLVLRSNSVILKTNETLNPFQILTPRSLHDIEQSNIPIRPLLV